jgi:DNA polymerase III delta prime subunit
MSSLEDILYQKYLSNQMAHFYILSGSEEVSEDSANLLLNKLFSKILERNVSADQLSNHADILYLKTQTNNYTIEEHKEIFQFLSFNALTLKRKFIIIPKAEFIGENFANKLLKVLEEPPINCTFILFNMENKELLSTIASRGVKLRLEASHNKKQSEENPIYAEIYNELLSETSLTSLIEKVLKKPELEKGYIRYLIAQIKELPNKHHLQTISALIDELKLSQEEQLLNSSRKNRFYRLLTLTKQALQMKINDQNLK